MIHVLPFETDEAKQRGIHWGISDYESMMLFRLQALLQNSVSVYLRIQVMGQVQGTISFIKKLLRSTSIWDCGSQVNDSHRKEPFWKGLGARRYAYHLRLEEVCECVNTSRPCICHSCPKFSVLQCKSYATHPRAACFFPATRDVARADARQCDPKINAASLLGWALDT